MRPSLRLLLLFSAILCVFAFALEALTAAEPPPGQAASASPARTLPNIVLLIADDLGYGELSCQNPDTDIPTPRIDSIAANGVRFTNGYVTAPFCAASRAGLMAGRYQTRFGFETNPIGAKNEEPGIGIPAKLITLPELLQDNGYLTALIGKWHLGGTAAFHPQRHGFDEFFGFTHEGHYFVPPPYNGVTTMLRRKTLPGRIASEDGRWTSPNGGKLIFSTHMGGNEPDYDTNNPIVRQSQPVDEPAYLTDAFTREALAFIDRSAAHETPFFLTLAYNAVHSPLQARDADLARFPGIDDMHRRIFAGMLANLDDSVGEVLAKLRDLGLEENTLIFFLSDNGGPTRELTSSNAPLRGEKGTLYDGGLRVPFLVQWKGTAPAGQVIDTPVLSLDIYATAAALLDVKPKAPLDGKDLTPLVSGEPYPDRPFFWRVTNKAALRHGDFKITRNAARGEKNDQWQLFNLATDIGESTDLASEMPEKVAELEKLWNALDARMIDPLW